MSNQRNTRALLLVGVVIAASLSILTACSPQSTANSSGGTQGKAADTKATVLWSSEADCKSCHASIAAAATATGPAAIYPLHAAQLCSVCHRDADGKLAAAHEDAKADTEPKKLIRTKVTLDSCLTAACHGTSEELGALTEGYDGNYNPHNSHNGLLECTKCHDMHGGKPTLYCSTCHNDIKKPEGWS